MSRSLFITGSSGFIAGHLLRCLPLNQYERVYCLSRNPTGLATDLARQEKFHFVQGSVLEPATYESQLAAADTVIHLAAVTGKAKRQEYFAVNTDGTAKLVEKCKELGVKYFLHTSTIAVKYANVKYYHYAQSKQLAEEIVRNSGLAYTIIRPTIVLAQDAPIWQSLRKMASKSVIMIPGSGRAKIQPIHVDDLIACILLILREQLFNNQTLDLGGPDVLSFESFLRQIHRGATQKEPRVVHLPLGLMRGCLGFLEKYLSTSLPVTAGQLSAFGNDGLANDNDVARRHRGQMKRVEEIIRLLLTNERSSANDVDLDAECSAFCAYLVGREPSRYISQRYCEGHGQANLVHRNHSNSFDRFIIRFGQRGILCTRMADIYTRWFYRRSALRSKLLLLMAILECSRSTYSLFEASQSRSKARFCLTLMVQGIRWTLYLIASFVFFSGAYPVVKCMDRIGRTSGAK